MKKIFKEKAGGNYLRCTPLLCFLLTLLMASGAVYAQSNVKFTHITNLEGLSQSTVQAMIKDKYGFLWFGTQDGLNRYDGYHFKIYRHQPKDSHSLRKSHILSLFEDRSGELWVGSANGGLSRFDRKLDRFIHYPIMIDGRNGTSDKSVTVIYEDKKNNFWLGTYWKLNLLDRKTGKFTQFGNDPKDPESISSDDITSILEDKKGNLWIGTSNGLNLLNRNTGKAKRYFAGAGTSDLSDNNVRSIYEDQNGRLWIGTGNGLNLYDHNTRSFTKFTYDPNNPAGLGSNTVYAITDAGDGKLWVGTNSSLDLFDFSKKSFTHYSSDPNVSTTLAKNGNITAMLRVDNILWVGTYQGGLNKYDEQLTFFDIHRNNPQDWESLSFNVVTSVAESPDGNIWVGTGGGALNTWNRATNKFTRFNPDPADKNAISAWGVLSLCQGKVNNYLWIGTYGNCIDRFDPITKTFKHYTKGEAPHQLNNDAVYSIYEDRKGNIWMGTNGGGVNVLDQTTGIITKFVNNPDNKNSITSNYVRCFYEDRKGHIWIGTTGGLNIYDPSTNTFRLYDQDNSSLESDVIFSLHADRNENMWIGTLGGGLNYLDITTKKITTYTTVDGLPDNTINSIVEDNLGFLWITTNNGISRFDPVNRKFKNSGLNNGLQSFEFSQGAGIKMKSGELLFGGINGFNVIDPERLIENGKMVPVVITGFRLFNKDVLPGPNSPLKADILETSQITLSYNQSIFTFEFAALGFTAPEKNQYAYMLEGFDKDWIYAGTNRKATYTNLNPGTYTFRVKASNNDEVWSDKEASLVIIIEPPFWQTWWFRISAILLMGGSIYLLYRSRINNMEKQKVLLENLVKERTQSLAAMTVDEMKAREDADEANKELERKNKELEQFAYVASHDLQEPLRTISSFVELLQKQYKGRLDERSDKYLSFITQASDRMKVLINDLLEYSRLGRKKELARVDCGSLLKEVTEDLAAAIAETKAEIRIDRMPVIHAYPTELKQVFQNLIINAIKFRKTDLNPIVEVKVEKELRHWKFSVSDNGIGIDAKHSERIFIIFQRLHTRTEYEGSGIGLSNCRKIVELHKGRIWVESEPGQGSVFYFTIPFKNEKI